MTRPDLLLDVPAVELEDDDAPEDTEYTSLIDVEAAARQRLRWAASHRSGPPSMRVAGRLLVESEAAAVEALRRMHEAGEVTGAVYREAARWLALCGCDGQMDLLAAPRGEETER